MSDLFVGGDGFFKFRFYSGRQIVRHGFAFCHLFQIPVGTDSFRRQVRFFGKPRSYFFQIEEKRSCFYVYERRLSGLNRFLSYRCDFPFPSADGFCRFGNDMFSFSGILLSVFGEIRLRSGWRACKKTSAYLSAFFGPMPFTPRNSSSVAGRVSAIRRRTVSERICDVDRFSFLPKSGGAVRVSHIYFFLLFCLFLLFLPLR